MSLPPLRHVGIIMDGNRRWAREHGLPTFEGHRRGYDRVKELGEWALAREIEVVSVFAFSTENWDRTQEEVGYLMDLLERALTKELSFFKEHQLRLRVLGRRDRLRPSITRAIERAEAETAQFTKMTLCLCLNYGGRPELVDAVKRIVAEGISADAINEATITKYLYWPDMPSPDLIIRTSGEERLSGFLLWEAAYSELYWCKHHWPAFTEQDFDEALATYANRQRRFGK